jgi:hypothetical protein
LTQIPWDKYVPTYLDKLEVVRLHVTTTFLTLGDYRSDFRLIYRCESPPPSLPLYFQLREIQANMIVLDSKNTNLVYLPHEESYEAAKQYLRTLWGFYYEEATRKSLKVEKDPPEVLLKIASFTLTPDDARAARARLMEEESAHSDCASLAPLTKYLDVMCTAYIPLVETPAASGTGYFFVRSGVDYFQSDDPTSQYQPFGNSSASGGLPTRYELLWFYLAGRLEIKQRVPFQVLVYAPWAKTHSLHMRLRLPPGLEVKGPPRTDFDEVLKNSHFLRALRGSQSEVYAYLAASEVRSILSAITTEIKRRETEPAMLTDSMGFKYVPFKPSESPPTPGLQMPGGVGTAGRSVPKAEFPELNILTKIGLPDTIWVLLGLFWALVISTYVYRLFGQFSISGYLTLLTALLIVVVATSIATIEKPTLRIPVSVHTVLAVAAFFVCLAV